LTPIWTGGVDRKSDRQVPTGLLGSIRWWFEVLVRGLGGAACDPSDTQLRCPDKRGRHCVVCELFGCTGWARKFRLQVLDKSDKSDKPQSAAIQRATTFTLRFVPLRVIRPEEWALLDITLRLIAKYGALGGKTVYKPSDEVNRQSQAHHWDYGIVEIMQTPAIEKRTLDQLKAYVSSEWQTLNHEDAAWASLENFWCVNGRYLARKNGNESTFNRVIGRPESKAQAVQNDSWLAGRRAGQGGDPESKKVFSFKSPARTFGFVKPGTITLDQMRKKLAGSWPEFNHAELLGGPKILDDLLKEANQA
jgi:CRISPR-associated protein Cmr1